MRQWCANADKDDVVRRCRSRRREGNVAPTSRGDGANEDGERRGRRRRRRTHLAHARSAQRCLPSGVEPARAAHARPRFARRTSASPARAMQMGGRLVMFQRDHVQRCRRRACPRAGVGAGVSCARRTHQRAPGSRDREDAADLARGRRPTWHKFRNKGARSRRRHHARRMSQCSARIREDSDAAEGVASPPRPPKATVRPLLDLTHPGVQVRALRFDAQDDAVAL